MLFIFTSSWVLAKRYRYPVTILRPLDIVNTTTFKVTEMGLSEFYDSIELVKIDEFIDNQREEDLHLDFKRLNEPRMDRADRKNLAIALSGFANADGGELLVGVEDDGQVTGVPHIRNQLDTILNAPKTHIHACTPHLSVK